MILTCSSCSTRYLIDPASVGVDGRTVKCAKCGHKWRELPSADLPKRVAEESAQSLNIEPAEESSPAAMSIEEMTVAAVQSKPIKSAPKKIIGKILGWLIFLLLIGGIVSGGYYGKQVIVEFWPASAKLYQLLKLDVKTANKLGLEIKNLKTTSVMENGVIRLTVTGTIVNLTGTLRPVPRIGIQLVDGEGHHVYSWSTAVDQENVEAWGAVEFSSSMNQPPKDAKHVKADLIPLKKLETEQTN